MTTTATNILNPTQDSFETDVLNSAVPTVVDFWAPWCPPCRMLKPVLEQIAGELNGKLNFAFVNVDEQPAIAEAFRVSGIPAVFIVKNGKVVDGWTGYIGRPEVLAKLNPHLA